jgi:hypothetical protein
LPIFSTNSTAFLPIFSTISITFCRKFRRFRSLFCRNFRRLRSLFITLRWSDHASSLRLKNGSIFWTDFE